MKPKTPLKIDLDSESKKVYFGDDGSVVDKPKEKKIEKIIQEPEITHTFSNGKAKFKKSQNPDEIQQKWYMKFADFNSDELKEIKDSEINALTQLCKSSFNDVVAKLEKSKFN